MSRQKDIERAQSLGQMRSGVRIPPGKQLAKCFYPPCPEQILIDIPSPLASPKPQPTTSPFCQEHTKLLQFIMWTLPRITVEKGKTPGGIVVPGHPAFKLNMEEK